MSKIICPNCGAVLSGGGSCPYCTGSTKGAEPADPRLYGPSEPIRDPVTGRILHRAPYGYDDTAYRGQSTHSVPTHGYQTGKPITGQSNPFLQQVRTYDREVSPAAITLSIIFLAYTKESLAGAFAVTGGLFGAMSLYGTLTKRDLTTMGSFCVMGLFGLILAGLVNIFLQSAAMDFVTSCIGVLVFTGLVAYDSQQIKRFGAAGANGTLAVLAALGLYLDFINLFLYVVRLMGRRK